MADDMIGTGGTLIQAMKYLKELGDDKSNLRRQLAVSSREMQSRSLKQHIWRGCSTG